MTIPDRSVSLGADPEFVFLDVERRSVISAHDVLSGNGDGQLGVDGAGIAGELRPRYDWDALALTKKIRGLLAQSQRRIGTKPLVMIADNGFMTTNTRQATGGHIHFGMAPNRDLIRALDCVSILLCALERKEFLRIRQGGSGYGRLTDYRTQNWGMEYRTPKSWLMTPEICAGVLALYHAVAIEWQHNFGQCSVPDTRIRTRFVRLFDRIARAEGINNGQVYPGDGGVRWRKWSECRVPVKYNKDIIALVKGLDAYKTNYKGCYTGLIDAILKRIQKRDKFPNVIDAELWGFKDVGPVPAKTYPLFRFREKDAGMQDIITMLKALPDFKMPRVVDKEYQILVGGLQQEQRPHVQIHGVVGVLPINEGFDIVNEEQGRIRNRSVWFRRDLRTDKKELVVECLASIAGQQNMNGTAGTLAQNARGA